MKVTLTDTLIKRHRAAGVRVELWDGVVPNFFVQVRESGQASFYIRYTSPLSGKKRALKLGDTAIWPTDKARQLAREKLALVDQGRDPADERDARKGCPTLAEVVAERYLPHVKATKASWETDEIYLRCHILPALGRHRLSAITTEMVAGLLNAMRHGGKADGPKGRSKVKRIKSKDYAPGTCNRIRVLIRYLFNLSIEKWKIPGVKVNPAKDIADFPDSHRQVFLNPNEIQRLLEAGRPRPGMQNPHTLLIVMLLTLTGVRKANALKAEWAEFDLVRGLWNLPAHKTKQRKPQTIQLAQEVLNLLDQLPSRETGERYLFSNPRTDKPYCSIYASWNTMRNRAALAHFRMHDLRHTFASLLINGGASLFLVQNALGHASPQTTMRYAHLAESTQRQAIQAAAAQIPCNLYLPTASGGNNAAAST
jgi:integrase